MTSLNYQGASILIEDLHGITVSIINRASVNDCAESIDGLRVTGPFVIHLGGIIKELGALFMTSSG